MGIAIKNELYSGIPIITKTFGRSTTMPIPIWRPGGQSSRSLPFWAAAGATMVLPAIEGHSLTGRQGSVLAWFLAWLIRRYLWTRVRTRTPWSEGSTASFSFFE